MIAVRLVAAALTLLALMPVLDKGKNKVSPGMFVDDDWKIPDAVLEAAGSMLPEKSNASASFLSDAWSPNLVLSGKGKVRVTFVHEGAGYHNALGYFTYREDPLEILDRQLIFPDASYGEISTGDTVTLRDEDGDERTFDEGTRIGFFLVADGWYKSSDIKSWNASKAKIPSTDPAVNLEASSGYGVFTTLHEINPEVALNDAKVSKHVAMLRLEGIDGFLDGEDFLLVGFEDLNRAYDSDDDFNDLVFFVTSTPEDILDDTHVETAAPGDPDDDGVGGTDDQYPHDPERALVTSYPSKGRTGVGLEDLYPEIGDGDFNDAVVAWAFDVVTSSDGMVKDVVGTFDLLARGSSYTHVLGLHIPGLPDDVGGSVEIERFLSDDVVSHQVDAPFALSELVLLRERRLETLFPPTHVALPDPPGSYFPNTRSQTKDRDGASARVRITFDVPVDPKILGTPPYDLYWLVYDGETWVDVHRAGFDAFADRPDGFPEEQGASAFVDDDGFPWMIEVPQGWRFPLEARGIQQAYPGFLEWAASHGTANTNWYDDVGPEAFVSPASNAYLASRTWTVTLPAP